MVNHVCDKMILYSIIVGHHAMQVSICNVPSVDEEYDVRVAAMFAVVGSAINDSER